MQAKSFLSEMREHMRQFYATSMRGEASDTNFRGYLRAARQIEGVWQQTNAKLAALISQGAAPWEEYEQLRYSVVYSRAARACQVIVISWGNSHIHASRSQRTSSA